VTSTGVTAPGTGHPGGNPSTIQQQPGIADEFGRFSRSVSGVHGVGQFRGPRTSRKHSSASPLSRCSRSSSRGSSGQLTRHAVTRKRDAEQRGGRSELLRRSRTLRLATAGNGGRTSRIADARRRRQAGEPCRHPEAETAASASEVAGRM
jgi:hypothetical protein